MGWPEAVATTVENVCLGGFFVTVVAAVVICVKGWPHR